jgi:hypothetical protein
MRNVSNYDGGGGISDRELQEMMAIAESFRREVESWSLTQDSSTAPGAGFWGTREDRSVWKHDIQS